jgi:putative ubiquitin-RnfH superfamily antitoxin RatB of RatAB toxin-antitoxin module
VKRCTVVFATPARQWVWQVEIADAGTVGDALAAARAQAGALAVPWAADVGIFGELCGRERQLSDGERVEIYRPLILDPKESRRARVQRERAAARDPVSARPATSNPKRSNP